MTECQGCGAWNDTSRTICVLCGTSLAETDEWAAGEELPPLPPLPDGGLSASMPAWLRALPQLAPDASSAPPPVIVAAAPLPPTLEPLGPRADPRTFLTDDDFPRWLRDLAARAPTGAADGQAMPAADRPRTPDWPDWPGLPAPPLPKGEQREAAAEPAAPVSASPSSGLDGRPPAAVVAARALEERRGRSPWETLLLVMLFIGVIVAALWALVSNGVFSPSL